jgi:hypothetical protein
MFPPTETFGWRERAVLWYTAEVFQHHKLTAIGSTEGADRKIAVLGNF